MTEAFPPLDFSEVVRLVIVCAIAAVVVGIVYLGWDVSE